MINALTLAVLAVSFDMWPGSEPDIAAFVPKPLVREVVQQQQKPAAALNERILCFTASWCGPCQAMKRDVYPGLVAAGWKIGEGPSNHIEFVDVDAHPELAAKWGVATLPTFIRVSHGQEVRRLVGQADKAGIGRVFYGK